MWNSRFQSLIPSRPSAHPLERRCLLSAISFADQVEFNSGVAPDAIVAADFNGDGNTDLAVADRVNDQISIYYGNGEGSFTAGPVLNLSAPPSSLLAGDFDSSIYQTGFADLAVGCSPGGGPGSTVTVFLNDAGTFGLGQSTTVITGIPAGDPIAITAGDFNGDGNLDIATANYSNNSVSVLLGNGNGTFQMPQTIGVGFNPTSIVAANFNGGSTLDLAVADQDYDSQTQSNINVVTFLSNDAGVFSESAAVQLSTTQPDVLTAVDLNNDGSPDLAVGSLDTSGELLLNNGSFDFTQSTDGSLPGPAGAVAAADFNFDGDQDVVFADGGNSLDVLQTPSDQITVGTGDGTGGFSATANFPTGGGPAALAIGDFNNDGKPDIAVADEASAQISILLNDTAGTVNRSTTTTLLTSDPSVPYATPVQFTATVTAAAQGSNTSLPTGSVNFFDGSHLADTETIPAGTNQAVFSTSSLTVGSHQIYAQFTGVAGFAASTSNSVSQLITPTPGNGPDLIGTLISTTLPTTFAPGEAATAKVKITNQGNSIAHGLITNDLYLSLDDTLDSGDILLPLHGPLSRSNVNLRPNASVTLSGQLVVPTTVPAAAYVILTSINDSNTLLESDNSNNVSPSADTYTAVDEFGSVGGRANVKLIFPDVNGTNGTYQLKGPGAGTVMLSDEGVDVSLAGTTHASVLSIAPASGNLDLDSIIDSSPLGSLQAPLVSVSASLTLAGGSSRVLLGNVGVPQTNGVISIGPGPAATVSLGNLTSVAFDSSSGLHSLSVASFVNSSSTPPSPPSGQAGGQPIIFYPSSLTAPWIGTLTSRGEFDPQLALTGIGGPGGTSLHQAVVAGVASSWSITGNVGKIAAGSGSQSQTDLNLSVSGSLNSFFDSGALSGLLAAANFGSIAITGDLNGNILAGFNSQADTFAAGSINSLHILGSVQNSLIAAGISDDTFPFDGSETLLPGGRIGSFFIAGSVDTASRFVAAALPRRVHVDGSAFSPADNASFGI